MQLFAAWLNFTYCDALVTQDIWVPEGGSTFLKHYLVDFSGALGAGRDWDDRPLPKDPRSGYENIFTLNFGSTLKTALSLGFWYRPWMQIDYPAAQYPEIGTIEAEASPPRHGFPNIQTRHL